MRAPGDALRAYQDARRKLVGELGIEPGERLRELERAILAQDPALAFMEQRARSIPHRSDASRGVFVGRERELEALAEVAAASAHGPVVAVVVGEPGSGKSRLLAEARTRSALPHSFAVVGYEPERQVPLAAASGLLRALGEVPERGTQVETLLFGDSPAGRSSRCGCSSLRTGPSAGSSLRCWLSMT